MKTKVVEFVVQDCPVMVKVIHRHYIDVPDKVRNKK